VAADHSGTGPRRPQVPDRRPEGTRRRQQDRHGQGHRRPALRRQGRPVRDERQRCQHLLEQRTQPLHP
jgi:hypothetical protein